MRFPRGWCARTAGGIARPSRVSYFASGAALVTTLLVLVVLSLILVVFLQSMSVEMRVARSSSNLLQARLLADSAAEEAVQRLLATTTGRPLASIWDRDASGNPYLFLAERLVRGSNVVTTRVPLFSTAAGGPGYFESLAAAQIVTNAMSIPDLDGQGSPVARWTDVGPDLIARMNEASAAHSNGMVGQVGGGAPLPVNWVYVRNTGGRVIGRYAFWVDDECCKLDLRFAGQGANAGGAHSRGGGTNLSDLSLLALTAPPVSATSNDIANLLALRTLPDGISDPSQVQYPLASGGAGLDAATWQRMRPYVTVHSLHDDRSPDGKRRLDLNAVVSPATTPGRIAAETFAIRDAIASSLPGFGIRFYSADSGAAVTPSVADQAAYVTKIAANIRDAIDADPVATIIQSDGSAYAGNSPGFIPYAAVDSDLPIAFGKEAGPFLSEYFRVLRVLPPEFQALDASVPLAITIRFAHYIELHNPSGRSISYADLGPDPFVILSNRTSWNNGTVGGSPSVLRLGDIKIRLPSTFVIPAGGYAVLTTDGPPWCDAQAGYIGTSANRYVVAPGTGPGQWELVNTDGKQALSGSNYEDYQVNVAAAGDMYELKSAMESSASYSDQRERLALGNQNGLIDYTLRIYTDPGGNSLGGNENNPAWVSTFLSDSKTETSNTQNGSDTEPRLTRGDVRSNTEVSRIAGNTSACWKNGGSAYGTTLYKEPGHPGGPQQTLGTANYNTAQSTQTGVARWRQWLYEHTADPAGNHFVANRKMDSPGDLGAIYDPARHDINGYRSQGATLRIGHSDAPTNNRANNATGADYANWLGGRGADDVTSALYLQNAFLLMDVFRTDDRAAGRVNPNCLVRDPAALGFRAVLDNFVFETADTNRASSTLSGRALNATNTIAALQKFATNPSNGFFVSAGDLSRSPVFSTSTTALAGVSMSGASDAGREEWMRRSANLLTTQSLAFTVFIRAQAGAFERTPAGTDRFLIKSSTAREMVVQLQPVYDTPSDPLVPTAPKAWEVLYPRTRND